MWRGEVFAISDCLVRYVILLIYIYDLLRESTGELHFNNLNNIRFVDSNFPEVHWDDFVTIINYSQFTIKLVTYTSLVNHTFIYAIVILSQLSRGHILRS